MKKISSILLTLTMLFALCVPAFAGDAVSAITHAGAKEIADSVVMFVEENNLGGTIPAKLLLADENIRKAMYEEKVAPALTADAYSTDSYRQVAVSIAVESLALDYELDETITTPMKEELLKVIDEEFVGIQKFDKDDAKDIIADNFAGNDLDSLFDTLRKTVTDLGGRVSGLVGGGKAPAKPESKPSENQPEAGMKDPTGDTAIFAVLGLAAVAGATLVISKKKVVK